MSGASQVPGEPFVSAVLFDPGRASRTKPYGSGDVVPGDYDTRDPDDLMDFEAQSHGLNTSLSTLRRAG